MTTRDNTEQSAPAPADYLVRNREGVIRDTPSERAKGFPGMHSHPISIIPGWVTGRASGEARHDGGTMGSC